MKELVNPQKYLKHKDDVYLYDVNLLSAVVPHLELLVVTFDVLCDSHSAHLDKHTVWQRECEIPLLLTISSAVTKSERNKESYKTRVNVGTDTDIIL